MSRRRIFAAFLMVVGIIILVFLASQTRTNPDGTITINPNELGETAVEISEATSENAANIFNDFIVRLYNVPQSDFVRVLMVIGGAILLFAGWRVYNWIVLLAGIFIGGSMAVAVVGSTDTVINIVAFLVGALIGAGMAVFLYYVAVFLIGGYFGIVFATMMSATFGWAPLPYWALLIVLILGGIIMLSLSYELLVVLASVLGAQLIVIGLGLSPASYWILGLALLGIILQTGLMWRLGYGWRRRSSRPLFN